MTASARTATDLVRPPSAAAADPARLPVRAARPRPVLLFLVYGVFLVIVGVTATAQVLLTSVHMSTSAVNQAVATDVHVVRGFVDDLLLPVDLAPTPVSAKRQARLQAGLESFIAPRGILRAQVLRPDGSLVAGDAPATGAIDTGSDDWASALAGETAASIVTATHDPAAPAGTASGSLLREYLPLLTDGQVAGVVAVWRDASPILAAIDAARRDVMLVIIGAALTAAAVLYLVFRSSQRRLTSQTVALVEASRRDVLTGLLNHGSLVEAVAAGIERLHGTGRGLEIAIVDIDNFRMLNDTWGHAAGDDAILAVTEQLRPLVPGALAVGRYGPDEFLVAVDGDQVGTLHAHLEDIRRSLAGVRLNFGGNDLPLTVSAAIAGYPQDGASVTELLANAAVTLRAAKAGGGDTVLDTTTDGAADAPSATFDVFQGLILAVDAKDRYTKRHSEDVARYAMFIGRRMALPPEDLAILRVAGLLHDVGKIGIPDQILRKPGKLSSEEFDVVKQHVALGDAILRDLPDLDTIRAGVRHHHERWDGRGYLHALAGEDIPLLARILSVADTFSAMTTSRPYRKALDLREACARLADAAGSQLDERLVATFLDGLERDEDPPLPGDDTAGRLWFPDARVA